MKIHSDVLSPMHAINSLNDEKQAGRIAHHVTFKTIRKVGSRSHKLGLEIQLQARVRDNGRRAGNSGSYGAMIPEYDGFAATYDEWGWLLASLYDKDPVMVVGTVKQPIYADAIDFHHQTALAYNPAELIRYLRIIGDPYPYVRKGSARRGREGAGRIGVLHRDYWERGYRLSPRSIDEVRAFAHLTTEGASV